MYVRCSHYNRCFYEEEQGWQVLTLTLLHRPAFADTDWLLQLLRISVAKEIPCKDRDSLLKETDCLELKCLKRQNQEHVDFASSPPVAKSASTLLWQVPQLQKLIIHVCRVRNRSAKPQQDLVLFLKSETQRFWGWLFTSPWSLCSWGTLSTLLCVD